MAQDMEQFRRNIKNWSKAFPFVIEKTYKRFGPILISDIRRDSLSGQILNERTGNLKRSIRTIFKKEKIPKMLIGTDVTSDKGFGYGAYWFTHKRDFLNPSIDKNMDKISEAMADGFEREFSKVMPNG